MKTHPIIFSGPMVRALLEGRKTQTRRIIKPPPGDEFSWNGRVFRHPQGFVLNTGCPYGEPGDLLWMREAWKLVGSGIGPNGEYAPIEHVIYASDDAEAYISSPIRNHIVSPKVRPSMYMPRWASRLTLQITDVRGERVQDITEADCWAEGLEAADSIYARARSRGCGLEETKAMYACLWDSINGEGSWDENPWVWVLTFRVHHHNVDDFIKQKTA